MARQLQESERGAMGMTGNPDMERKSSAVTMSDMEIFIFPELMYSLVLANIMSPRIWAWRNDSWFKGQERQKPYRRIQRLKQFIMDRYIFNLDLDTWGLTTKERDLNRFRGFIDEDALRQSNALFGYEGDKYYFDIDIRTHFGLDKYEGDVIPYWKTETVEAMDAFKHKPGCTTGAGECVSLSALYAAALFVVAGIPLSDIFMMATPLHSQNFVDVDDGILTNNRRLVTKAMWFNGTALSAQARRALENERVTVVAHETGHIHTLYPDATIDPGEYARFSSRLSDFLSAKLTNELFGNFIRHSRDLHKCFQVRWSLHGQDHYIRAEKVFEYELSSPNRFTDETRFRLMGDIDAEEFMPDMMDDRIVLNDVEEFVRQARVDLNVPGDVESFKEQFPPGCVHRDNVVASLVRFCRVRPKLPDASAKRFISAGEPLALKPGMTREEIIERLKSIRGTNSAAELAFYAFRDLSCTEPDPFLMAAVQRCPVSLAGAGGRAVRDIEEEIRSFADESIYDEPTRLAQPDEVWNFRRGDGLEKAILMANLLRKDSQDSEMTIEIGPGRATLKTASGEYTYESAKTLPAQSWVVPPAR